MKLAVANLSISDDVDLDAIDAVTTGPDYSLSLVGTLLTRRSYNFAAFAAQMADLWQLGCGVNIEQLENQFILCRFRHIVDLRRVLAEGPWHFDMSLLILHEIKSNQTPQDVSLRTADFWIQLTKVPEHFFSVDVGESVGNTLGRFIDYDKENTYTASDSVMRIRVSIDVMEPLQIERKLRKSGFPTATCPLMYEKLLNFCYICGRLGHTDRLCVVQFQVPIAEIIRVWSNVIRAPIRNRRRQVTSTYLLQQEPAPNPLNVRHAV